MDESEESSLDERGWANASTSTLPPDGYEEGYPLLSPLSSTDPISLGGGDGRHLDVTIGTEEEEEEEEAAEEPHEAAAVGTEVPLSQVSTVAVNSEPTTVAHHEDPVQPGTSGQSKKGGKNKKKVPTRNKGTQVDIKLIGTSWPRNKKNTTSGEAGSKPKRTKKTPENQISPTPETLEGSRESLSQETVPEVFTSEENLSSSLTGQADLTLSDSSLTENIPNEQNFQDLPRGHQLSIIPEEPSDFEASPISAAQAEQAHHQAIIAQDQSIVPTLPAHPLTAETPRPVIANIVINFSRTGTSKLPSVSANSSIPSHSALLHNEPTLPVNVTFQSDQSHVNGPRASSSRWSLSSNYISTTSSFEPSDSFDSLDETMPPKILKDCASGESGNPDKKPAAASKKPKSTSKNKKPKTKSSSKKTTKKSRKSSHSRRCRCSESYSDDSYSSYTSASCSCSDCCSYSSACSSDSSDSTPVKWKKNKKTAPTASSRRKATLKK